MFCASAHPWKYEFVASHSSSASSSGRSWGKAELLFFFFPSRGAFSSRLSAAQGKLEVEGAGQGPC